jgi:hypothetical protein
MLLANVLPVVRIIGRCGSRHLYGMTVALWDAVLSLTSPVIDEARSREEASRWEGWHTSEELGRYRWLCVLVATHAHLGLLPAQYVDEPSRTTYVEPFAQGWSRP